METTTLDANKITVLGQDEGEFVHALDNLVTFKATAGTNGGLTAVELLAPRGFGPPLHCHQDEDELLVVLEGELAFRTGDIETVASAGACAYLPHGIPHTFQVLSDTARMLSVTAKAGQGEAPQFDRYFKAIGEPAPERTLPGSMPIDPAHVAAVSAEHNIEILGPPPAPLAD